MAAKSEFTDYVVDQLQPLGPVTSKRMFGGWGVFCDDLMFGLVADEVLYLKADDDSAALFEAADCHRFSFSKGDRTFSMSYFSCPDDANDDPELLREWGNIALAAALRAPKKPKKPKKKPQPSKQST